MDSPKHNPDAALSQLVRYVLTIGNMQGPDSIAQVREQLTGLGFVVDRLEEGEAEIASTHSNGPGLDAIRVALEAGGFQLLEADTNVG
ncbi:hypothetical protein [Hymenobacter arizonensis]|uniref:Uncharacterized protein n=1 Tax=Hymenobacter arizonensis TaxID=1227077 RepID=A0A1I5UBK3_HYMAR|nr:hypothetical protein [Hymenobacter arizonensis]SFP92327.1 hypothetical protein SAMN04515668_0840 [Hymenobacter arizonensis]